MPHETLTKMKKNLIVTFILLGAGLGMALADIGDEIASAVKSGNSKQLASFFYSNIELNIPGNEGIYSKAQAELILKDFFSKNQPKNFTIMHQGASKDGNKYTIGNLETGTGNYRTYFFLKKVGENFQIKELRVEADK